VTCNYPEAYKTPIVYVENFTVTTSTDRTFLNNPSIIGSSLPANMTFINVDVTEHYITLSFITPTIYVTTFPFCIPDDGLVQLVEFSNLTFGMTENDSGQKF
jgi:hypothetical protein